MESCIVSLRGVVLLICLFSSLFMQASHEAKADTLSVPFPSGFVGTKGSNTGQANAIVNFSTLGVANAYFIQQSDSADFGGTQGNDLSGTLRLSFQNGQVINVPGAINWRITQGSTLLYFGFIPAPGAASYSISYGSGQTYVLNANSNYGLRKIGATQSYADGSSVSGNASLSGLLTQLNVYLDSVEASGPKITGPSGSAGSATSAVTVNEMQLGVHTMAADKPVTWAIFGGADASKFTINSGTGALAFVTPPDYEGPTDADANNIYAVLVQATDGSGYTAQQTVNVTVADIDDTPPLIMGSSAVSVQDGQTAVTGFMANETVVWGLAGTDAGAFNISLSGEVSFRVAADFDLPIDQNGDNIYQVTVTGTDGAGNIANYSVVVTVTAGLPPDTTPPVVTGPTGNVTGVVEGQTAVATLSADEVVAWSLTGADAAALSIDSATGALTFATAPDFENPDDTDRDNIYQVTIIATDPAGNVSQFVLAVTVTDLTEDTQPPVITGPSAGSVSVNEGITAITTLTADEAVAWSLTGADAADFAIDASTGELNFAAAPDFENPTDTDGDNIYQVTIVATDPAGNFSQFVLTVTVTDLAEDTQPPVITGPSGGNILVAEGVTALTTLSADETVVWSLTGVDAVAFSLDATTGALTFTTAPDFENPSDADTDNIYQVTIVATDPAGNVSQFVLTVTVTDLAEDTQPPVISGPSGQPGAAQGFVQVPEGQIWVTTLSADEAVTWAITSGPDAALFIIGASNGTLSFLHPPLYLPADGPSGSNDYTVVITGTDVAGNVASLTITVTVTDVIAPDTAAPTIGTIGGDGADRLLYIDAGDSLVADFAADEDVTWALGGPDMGRFTLDPVTGVLLLIQPDATDPLEHVYTIVVTATDLAGNVTTVLVTVVIAPADAIPPDTELFETDLAHIITAIQDIETAHLRTGLLTLQSMTSRARARFVSARRMRQSCLSLENEPGEPEDEDCPAEARQRRPFTFAFHLQDGEDGTFAAASFHGQTSSPLARRRRLAFGDLSYSETPGGPSTRDVSLILADERLLSENVMLGIFVGGRSGQSSFPGSLSGRTTKRSLSIGTYFAAALTDDLYLDGFLSVEASRNTLQASRAALQFDGDYRAHSVLAGLALSGSIAAYGFEVRPELSATIGMTKVTQLTLTATSGADQDQTTAAVRRVSFATLRMTPEILVPIYREADTAQLILAPSVLCEFTNSRSSCGGGVRVGLQGSSPDGSTTVDATISTDWVGGTRSSSVSVNVVYRF
jgi:Tfp pilus assembly protein PilX